MSVKAHKLRQCRCERPDCQVCKWERRLRKDKLDHLDSENSEGDIIVGNRGSGKIISRKHGEARDESEEAMEHRRAILANHRFRSPRDKRVYAKYAAGFGTPAVAKGLRDSDQHGTSTWAVQRLIARVEREYRADKAQPLTHVQLAKLLLECDATTVTLLFELLRRAMDDPSGMGQLLDKAEDIPQIRAILDPAPEDELTVTTKNDFEVEIRDGTPDDLGYVIDTLENSLRHRYLEADRKDFSNSCRALLAREMRNGASLYVACCPDVPTEIWGWSLTHDAAEVLFVYVRHKYRGQGIATGLLQWAGFSSDDEITVRHMTLDASNIKYGKRKKLRYIPYL